MGVRAADLHYADFLFGYLADLSQKPLSLFPSPEFVYVLHYPVISCMRLKVSCALTSSTRSIANPACMMTNSPAFTECMRLIFVSFTVPATSTLAISPFISIILPGMPRHILSSLYPFPGDCRLAEGYAPVVCRKALLRIYLDAPAQYGPFQARFLADGLGDLKRQLRYGRVEPSRYHCLWHSSVHVIDYIPYHRRGVYLGRAAALDDELVRLGLSARLGDVLELYRGLCLEGYLVPYPGDWRDRVKEPSHARGEGRVYV